MKISYNPIQKFEVNKIFNIYSWNKSYMFTKAAFIL